MRTASTLGGGPALVGWTTLAIGAMLAVIGVSLGPGEAGLRLAIRLTARTSFLLFALAFLASALQALSPGPISQYLVRNRRYLGLSFGVSHLYHLAAILLLVAQAPSGRVGGMADFVPGGFLYLWILLMMATSSNRAVHWLGPRRWRVLHRLGMYFIFVGFLKGFGLAIPLDPLLYGPLFGMLLGLLGLRIWAWRTTRRRPGPLPSVS
jgi:DMSO/TMAO reductase YedYZ heme-binding membrane subunit